MPKDSWIWKQWQDVRGNVKFLIACKISVAVFGGTTLAALVVFWQRVTGLPSDAMLPAVICIASAFMFYLCLSASWKMANASGVSEAIPTPDEVSMLLPPQRLNIEVLEGHAGLEPRNVEFDFGSRLIWMLLKVRIAPRSEPGVSINEWHVSYADGGYWRDAEFKPLPLNLQYATMGQYGVPETPKSPIPSIQELTEVVPYGHRKIGFLLVQLYGDFPHECFRYEIQLRVTDALGTDSSVVVPPGEWLRPTDFSYREVSMIAPPVVLNYPSPPEWK